MVRKGQCAKGRAKGPPLGGVQRACKGLSKLAPHVRGSAQSARMGIPGCRAQSQVPGPRARPASRGHGAGWGRGATQESKGGVGGTWGAASLDQIPRLGSLILLDGIGGRG